MEYESVNNLSDGIVICRCLAKIRNYVMPKNINENQAVAAKLARIQLAEYNLNLLKKNGKLRPGIKEEEFNFRTADLLQAQQAAFRT